MTPAVAHCTNRCLYCWRIQPEDLGVRWNELVIADPDPPELIVEGCLQEQRRLLAGFLGNPKADRKKVEEAFNPRHAAISLSGEPTLYPLLGELIEEFHKRGMTTFLVTNGTNPEVLEKITPPSQLYISVSAPNEEVYKKVVCPIRPDNWSRLLRSLELMRTFSCPTVIRITLVKDVNMLDPEGYSKLIELAEPTYIEAKAYMHLGFSVKRLKRSNMPAHEEVRAFSQELVNLTGYRIIDESPPSRVVLLSKLKQPKKIAPP